MSLWEAVFLGFLQGTTEFLPVSSSGHLVVGQALLGLDIPGVQFEVAVHVATLVSVVLVYHGRIRKLIGGALSGDAHALRYLGFLVVASLPIVFVGAFFRHSVEALFESPFVPAVAFLVTGTMLWTTRRALRRESWPGLGVMAAMAIGLAQAFAVVPGISRSGATVVAALWMGVEAEEAAAFSFLMAIPAIAGAAVLQLWGSTDAGTGLAGGALILGSVVAAVTGVVAIRAFIAFLARQTFYRFGVYCWALGAAFLVYLVSVG